MPSNFLNNRSRLSDGIHISETFFKIFKILESTSRPFLWNIQKDNNMEHRLTTFNGNPNNYSDNRSCQVNKASSNFRLNVAKA